MNKTKIFVLAAMMALVSATTAIAAPVNVPDLAPGGSVERYIVAFHGDPGLRAGDQYQGERVVEFIDGLNFIVIETRSPAIFEGRARLDDSVRFVEWDDPAYATLNMVPNDSRYGDSGHWGSKRIGDEAAWDVTTGSSAVKIAVVDSGLNKGHEEFAGQSRVLDGFNFNGGNTDTSDSNSCNFHGTHVAGTLGATINNGRGIAGMSQSSILPVKIFAGGFFGCGTSTTAIVNALKYAGDQGAHISQNSWGGGGSSSAINDAIKYAHGKGTTHVAAAGNSGPCTNCVGQPWKDNPSITIIVSSSDSNDAFSSFSSQGPEVTVIAPGRGILSSTSGTGSYSSYSGTSMAAPHVSGAFGLYIAQNGNVGFSKLKTALTSNAENLGHSSDRQGAGLVRVDAMLGASGGGGGGGGGGGDPTPSDTIHVHDIQHKRKGSPRTGDLEITLDIRDSNEAGASGASICIEVSKSGGSTATGCGTTGSTGTITFVWGGVGGGTYTTCVTSLSKSGYTWDQSADHASSGRCHTSSV